MKRPKTWKRTSKSPEAYATKDNKWGLVQNSGNWELHLLKRGFPVKKIQSFQSDDPFPHVEPIIQKYALASEQQQWDEAEVGRRVPGEEGPNGGRPIPLQTKTKKQKIV